MDRIFKFELGARVALTSGEAGEAGEVVGRAEYQNAEATYYLRYVAADGRQTECWWGESALVAA